MELRDAPLLFGFEIHSSEDFTYIPMIVRFHLDRCGLRISLDQWQQLPLDDRKRLARFPAAAGADPDMTPDRENPEIDAGFGEALARMLHAQGVDPAETFEPEPAPGWADRSAVPPALTAQCALAGLPAPSTAQWAALGPFERYVLAKLSRKPKLNHDFIPAMREFALAPA
ncbi:nitrate reductase associated protein [Burkholderia sp. Ac-20379]|uniref:nitrate reductase associated protein n=1 Tax=Burkholderia sp. Ac-20379 TaxID=2703900 RepID=UPI00197D719E|nr:nitrate reductase associated protein [Burkholderia sp. Ac-20379]MBN3724304.1 nitrate reductase maturation protein NarM [Burkholderia sp. Ac-20379]